jgi:dihydrofolate reductase
MSLDGYTEDRDGGINWGAPDEEYFSFINDLQRSVGTFLYGRRMYEAMAYWETAPVADQPPWVVDFANIWRAVDKVVFSKTLASVSSGRTTLEREFNVGAIRRMKAGETVSTAIANSPQAAIRIPQGGTPQFPRDGHEKSPRTAMVSPHGRPRELPAGSLTANR